MARKPNQGGQAAGEYVAILLVVALALGGAATAAHAVPGVGPRVIATVRTGLCIVGGDLCRTADAQAAGLAPCLTEEHSRRRELTIDIALLRLGEHGEWQLSLQSDGTALVTRLAESDVGGTVGVGVEFSPARLDASVSATLVAGYRGGAAWRFPDARAAAAFVADATREDVAQVRPAPDVRWDVLGVEAGVGAGVALDELAGAGLSLSAEKAIGLRRDGARRTLTFRADVTDPHLAIDLPGFPAAPGPRRSGVIDVSWAGDELQELVLRSVVAEDGKVDELSARLDLHDPVSRALAVRMLTPGSGADDASALVRYAAREAIVEHTVHTVSERRRGFSAGARLGLALGLRHQQIASERRLVQADAWVRGGPLQHRLDCLGL